jgi:adenylate cyclase class 2
VPVEHEVKLEFSDVETARRALVNAGGRLVVSRRLIDDLLFDTADGTLRRSGTALRLRREGVLSRLTWKGPLQSGLVKSREELETTIGDASAMEAMLLALGYQRQFRAQKYREEYSLGSAVVTVDEAPFGVFVEIEAPPSAIAEVTVQLGRTAADYRLESYPALWRLWCARLGREFGDMVFEERLWALGSGLWPSRSDFPESQEPRA